MLVDEISHVSMKMTPTSNVQLSGVYMGCSDIRTSTPVNKFVYFNVFLFTSYVEKATNLNVIERNPNVVDNIMDKIEEETLPTFVTTMTTRKKSCTPTNGSTTHCGPIPRLTVTM